MTKDSRPRILIVDDEEAILETMTFTFEDDYDVYTSADARRALEILDEKAPIAAVLTDQRMPNMSGVEFVAEVWKRHPSTVRMILTGFSDMDAIIKAINDGHVYAYIPKPWEPDHLKQVMKQAVEYHDLTVENERLLTDLKRANSFLEAVMDQLDTGALAVDAAGIVQAVNRSARDYLALDKDPRGRSLTQVFREHGLEIVSEAAFKVADDDDISFHDVEIRIGDQTNRLRINTHNLMDAAGKPFGQVILAREVSHEPLQRRYNDLISELLIDRDDVRARLEQIRDQLPALIDKVKRSKVESLGMTELAERASRALTAVENWLEADDAMATEEFPDSQLLQDRMRVALSRWPHPDEIPERVRELARRVEEYYESGENPKQRVL
jgi:CheY-like chemotaxis protein